MIDPRIAQRVLSSDELAVWLAKTIEGLGRRRGSLALGISEEQFRRRLLVAERKLAQDAEERAQR